MTEDEPVEPVHGTTGVSVADLKKNTVDPAAEVDESGHKPFLKWKKVKQDDGTQIEQAEGEDGSIYTISEVPPEEPESTYVLNVTSP